MSLKPHVFLILISKLWKSSVRVRSQVYLQFLFILLSEATSRFEDYLFLLIVEEFWIHNRTCCKKLSMRTKLIKGLFLHWIMLDSIRKREHISKPRERFVLEFSVFAGPETV